MEPRVFYSEFFFKSVILRILVDLSLGTFAQQAVKPLNPTVELDRIFENLDSIELFLFNIHL